MKVKLFATVDAPLVEYLDSLPGQTRSEKLELVIRRYRELQDEIDLRIELAAQYESQDGRREREDWELIVAEAQWREGARTGPDPSR